MKWIACIVAIAACQRGKGEPVPEPAAAVTAEYRQDIVTLCDVVHLSEADKMPPAERWPIIAMWLGPHLTTSEAHDFLVRIQPLTGEPKASALEAEAKRVGLDGCALAAEWRQ